MELQTANNDVIIAVIPAFNEERLIGSVVLKTRRYVSKVIVIDDGSSDDTARVAQEAGATVIRLSVNKGKGEALATGLKRARQENPAVVVVLDGDGQHDPGEINRLVEPILAGQADIVLGSRYLNHASKVPRHRVLGHWFFNRFTSTLSGVRATDSQSGFRAFSPRALEVFTLRSSGFSVESEMQFIIHDQHLKLMEAPITIRYDDKPKRPVIQHGWNVLNGILRLVGQYRPLLFLGVPGVISLVSGLLWGIWVVNIYRQSQELAVGYAMVSVLLVIVGLVGLSTGITLHSIRALLIDWEQHHRWDE